MSGRHAPAFDNAGHSSRSASPLVCIRCHVRCGDAVGGLLSRFLWFSGCRGVHSRLNDRSVMLPDFSGRVGGLKGSPKIVVVVIKQSKTHPFRRAATISLKISGIIFAVSALLAYLARRDSSRGLSLSSATALLCLASA